MTAATFVICKRVIQLAALWCARSAYEKIRNILRQNNLRPTNQRIAIFDILFSSANWHFSAEIVEKKCCENGIKISAGTIYNVLNDFYVFIIHNSLIFLDTQPDRVTASIFFLI